jgi:hypothetical protein
MVELGRNIDQEEAPPPPKKKAKVSGPAEAVKTVRIILEENDLIPPSGLFLGHNGKGYYLKPGMEANVPMPLIEILNHAIELVPQVNPETGQVDGYREKTKYPYRIVTPKG